MRETGFIRVSTILKTTFFRALSKTEHIDAFDVGSSVEKRWGHGKVIIKNLSNALVPLYASDFTLS